MLGIALSASACNSPGGIGMGTSDQGNGLASHPPMSPEKLQDELRGAWLSSCLTTGERSVGNYLEIDGERFKKSVYSFSDPHCQDFDYKGDGLMEGIFKIAGPSATVDNAYDLDFDGSDAVGTEILRFDLIRLGDDGKHLYFGLNPGDSEAARAKELDLSTIYTRVE